jgi:hypothetical protein
MATLLDLELQGLLFKLDPVLEPNEQEWRRISTSENLTTWIKSILPTLVSEWKIEVSPTDQLDALVEIFCSGETITYSTHFKPLAHLGDGVWELKTSDVRVFGFFHVKDWFVGVVADDANKIKRHGLYPGYANEVVRYRNTLNLDNPKYVSGDDPNDVVSNYDFP